MKALRSLQGRLLAWVLGLVLCLWLLSAVATWLDARHELDELLDSHLAQAAALLVVQQPHGDWPATVEPGAALAAPLLHHYAPRTAFQVWHHGRLVQRSANAPGQPLQPVSGAAQGFHEVVLGGRTWRVFVARSPERGLQVFVGERLHARQEIVLALLRSTLWPSLLALPLLALATWWAVRQAVAPLRALGDGLRQRRPQDLAPLQLAGEPPEEMHPLLQALNQLFGRIQGLLDNERRFTADAAHELRTPIAALRAQAQAALLARDDNTRQQALLATLQGCDRATRLVEQLLQLARLEAVAPGPGNVVELGALVRRVVADLAPTALARGQVLDIEAEAACPVLGDDSLLTVLVRNLVDNAARYSPDGATLRVHLLPLAGGRVQLRVEDSGPGLPDESLHRLGERFFRALGNNAPGSGLGWSIVRRVATVLGAGVQVQRSAALGGLCVLVDLRGAGDQATGSGRGLPSPSMAT
jgi:two-component system sensor histidine kinase QseC